MRRARMVDSRSCTRTDRRWIAGGCRARESVFGANQGLDDDRSAVTDADIWFASLCTVGDAYVTSVLPMERDERTVGKACWLVAQEVR